MVEGRAGADVCVDDTLAREEEVLKLILVKLWCKLEALEVVPEELGGRRYVALLYRAQSRQLRLLLIIKPEEKIHRK